MAAKMTEDERAALDRLVDVARGVTGQSRKVADFLLAWWDAETCGGFDPRTLWGVDRSIAEDMVTVFAMIGRVESGPDTLGYGAVFEAFVKHWRGHLDRKLPGEHH